jgi:peptidoglycan/xylan/chitin deacetylase (PgdA/CDA1 family)
MSIVFTYSTDDGHPSDMKIAELLVKNNLNGTFFVPIRNQEGRDVLSLRAMREIGGRFEIASHTHDHYYLKRLTTVEAHYQIIEGKKQLEELLGKEVVGFCYPGGKYRPRHLDIVKAAGFRYARTTMNLCFDSGPNPYEMRTTFQFYPHDRIIYLRNYVKDGKWLMRHEGLRLALKSNHWIDRLYYLFEWSCRHGTVFHLWGHSWEIDELGAWQELDQFLAYVASRVAREDRLDNRQLAHRCYAKLRPDTLPPLVLPPAS